jgi:hypothetical protein
MTGGDERSRKWQQRVESIFERWGYFIYRNRWSALAATILVTGWLMSYLPGLTIDNSTESFLLPDDPAVIVYNQLREQFGRDDRILLAIEAPDLSAHADRTPVLVDDVLSTGRTMMGAAEILVRAGFDPPVCAAVHGVFSGDALEAMAGIGLTRIVTCDTVAHPTNEIDTTSIVVAALCELGGLRGLSGPGSLSASD